MFSKGLGKFGFKTTDWSEVRRAGDPSSEDHFQAMEKLLEGVRPALLAHLVYRRNLPKDRAEDILHDFFASRLLRGGILSKADRCRGRFRTFLLNSLDNFVISGHRKEGALKNSPNRGLSLDDDEQGPVVGSSCGGPDVFDVAWAECLLRETLAEMEEYCRKTDQGMIWDVFELRMLDPILKRSRPIPYEDLVKQFQFASPVQAYNALITGKRMFLRILRTVVGRYTEGRERIDQEIEELKEILYQSVAEWTAISGIQK